MTGLEKITQEIQQAAQAEADEIIKAAETEAEELVTKSKSTIDARCNAIIANAEVAAKDTQHRTESSVDLQHRQDILQVKQSLLRETITLTKEAVTKLPPEEYLSLLTTLAKQADLSGKAELRVRQEDRPLITDEFLKNFPEHLQVTLGEQDADIAGGFILVGDSVTVNSSIDAIFDRYQDKVSDTILGILFD